MKAIQQNSLPSGLGSSVYKGKARKNQSTCVSICPFDVSNVTLKDNNGLTATTIQKNSHLFFEQEKFLYPRVTARRKQVNPVCNSHSCSDYDIGPTDGRYSQKTKPLLTGIKEGIFNLVRGPIFGLHPGSVKSELLVLALPAFAGQALDPLAQLMETAYIGRLGPVELASAGVSVSIFNIISKLFNVPLLSITTSFVAEDISKNASRKYISDGSRAQDFQEQIYEDKGISHKVDGRMELPSVSTALLLATGIGVIEASALFVGAGVFLNLMGISSASPMLQTSQKFLSLRALGAPAVVVSLAVQGVFRGFKDTKTPLFCVGLGNISSVVLLPIFVYTFHLGITGAAIATVVSQYITTFLLIWSLSKRAVILPPKIEDLQFGGYLSSGGLLLGRTLSVLITMTLGTSMAARQGPLAMAAHQICLQVWLAVSLLSDALAVSAQALIATSFAQSDYKRVKEVTFYVLKIGMFTGISLALILGASFGNIAELFTKDAEVLQIVKTGLLFVSASQPINALAFIFDGLHYGVSDFSYSAYSMMLVGAISSAFLLFSPSLYGLAGVWSGLTLFMGLRMTSGFLRLCWKSGPWWFLQEDLQV